MIRERVRRHKKITESDINDIFRGKDSEFFDRHNYSNQMMFWSEHGSTYFTLDDTSYNQRPVANQQLPALRRCLMAIQDETVTPASLRNLGFDKIEWLFRKAVQVQ